MRICDTCPGGSECAGTNLHPILSQVLNLYTQGVTDKFDILFTLGDESEALLEKYNDQISRTCWTRAALLAIADSITKNQPDDVDNLVRTAIKAFERFPWQISELVEQAPGLYQIIVERDPDGTFSQRTTKRTFMKICKSIAYP
jgi:hypothetical protein